ncbi:hypothetical protein FB446DRAFT_751702 [Lentinula raphanica]|nr:hypothetical protein FB446DRAFT_751702 [Lentinula raphanica]
MKFHVIASCLLLFLLQVTTVEALAWTAWGACHLQWEHLGGSKRAGDTCSYKPLRVPRSSEIHGTCQVPHEGKSLVCLATGTQGQSGQTGAGLTQGMSDMSQAGSMGASAGSMPAPDSTMSGVPGGGSSSAYRRKRRASFSRRTV